MKKLLPLAIASMFVLSGSVFAADTASVPDNTKAPQASSVAHKAGEKTKHHKKHAKVKSEAKESAKDLTTK